MENNLPGIDGKEFKIVLNKNWFIEDAIRYEYKKEGNTYTLIESNWFNKMLKTLKFKFNI